MTAQTVARIAQRFGDTHVVNSGNSGAALFSVPEGRKIVDQTGLPLFLGAPET